MRIRWGRAALFTALALFAVGLAALIAPRLDAERMRAPLAAALHETLGRPVEFREVHYQILPAPGLSAIDLVIPDDPAFGLEPLAYVGEMQAGVSLSSLFTGRLSISSVRLVAASVNLTRRDDNGWNLARLLQRMAAGVTRSGSAPSVTVTESRINFKNGLLKSPFFLNAVDLELQPPANGGGALEWRYEASPARTDRSEQGFGRFSGGGKWRPGAGGDGEVAIDLAAERSSISEVLTLITGRDLALQGRVSSRATLDGPLHNLRVRGTAELENVDRPGWFGLRGGQWAIGYEGVMDLAGQTLRLHTLHPNDKQPLPLTINLACTRLLAEPQWDATFAFDELPAPALLELARRLGVLAPATLTVEGNVIGSLAYSQSRPLEGSVELRQGKVSMGPTGPLAIPAAQLSLAGPAVTLAPVTVETASGSQARIAGQWRMDSQTLDFSLETERLPFDELRAAAASLQGVPPLPVLDTCQDGFVQGRLRFERGPAKSSAVPAWSGRLHTTQMTCSVEGAPDPLRIESAEMTWKGASWTARQATGAWGPWKFRGDAEFLPETPRPWRFRMHIDEATGASLDRFLQSARQARRSLLDRTLRRQPTVPAWLRDRHAQGTLHIGRLALDQQHWSGVSARLFWDGVVIEAPEISAAWEEADVHGRLTLRLGGALPEFRFLGRVDNLAWMDGVVDSELELRTSTLGGPFPAALRVDGRASGRSVELAGEQVRQFQACFDYDGSRAAGRLKLACLEAQLGGEWLYSPSPPTVDGRLELEFTGPKRSFRFHLPAGDATRTR